MLSANTFFYKIYNTLSMAPAEQPSALEQEQKQKQSPLIQYHTNGGTLPQNNAAYRLKQKFEVFATQSNKDVFCKAQKTFWTLFRFFRKLSLSKKVKYNVSEDLYGAPFVPRFTIELVQNNCIYQFSIHDLLHIIKTSLSAVVSNWYPNPKMPCNPYTNQVFEKHHLYSIYCFSFLQTPRLLINQLLIAFLRAKFCLETFKKNNHKMLLEMFINTLVAKDIPVTVDVIADILLMIKTYRNVFVPIDIDARIDKKTLYTVFRPYLRLFYKYKFLQCTQSLEMLKRGLRNFALFNPLFGHIYYSYETKKVEIDVRCLSCGDFSENNSVFETFIKLRGHDNTIFLPPIKNAYYYPKKAHKPERPELKIFSRDAIYEPPRNEEAEEEEEAADEDTDEDAEETP